MRIVLAGALAAFALVAGCGGGDGDSGTETNSRRFNRIAEAASASGGVAMRIVPGQSAKLEVGSYDSPIYGTSVSLPADAARGAKDPVLVILPVRGFTAEGTEDDVVSRAVEVRLYELASGEAVKLESPALMALPFTTSEDTDLYNMHIGRYDADAKEWSYLTAERPERSRTRMLGKTTTFGLFAALQALQPIEDGTFFFRVLRKGEAVCEGRYETIEVATEGGVNVINAAVGEVYVKPMYNHDRSFAFTSRIRTSRLVPPDPGELDMSEAFGDESQLQLECGSLRIFSKKLANQLIREETFSDWLTQYAYPVQACLYYPSRSCFKQAGVVHIRGRFVFIADDEPGTRAIVTYDNDFSWFTWDKLQ